MVKAINQTPVTCSYEKKKKENIRPKDGSRNPALCRQEEKDKPGSMVQKKLAEYLMWETGTSEEQADGFEQPDQSCLYRNGRPAAGFCDMLPNPKGGKKNEV